MKREDHDPLVIGIVEFVLRESKIDVDQFWAVVEGKRTRRKFAVGLAEAFLPLGGLPLAPNRDMFGAKAQMQTAQAEGFEGRPPTDHPFVHALRAKGLTLTMWAAKHYKDGRTVPAGVHPRQDQLLSRMAVKGWYTPGAGARQIPIRWAKLIEKEFGLAPGGKRPLLPATEAIWRNGIRE